MPYFITQNQPDCSGWATVKEEDDGSLTTIGCHETKQDAIDQMVAVSVAEDMEPGGERNLDGEPAIVVDIDGTMIADDGSPIQHVIDYVNAQDAEVIVVTARLESRRSETIQQLDDAGVDYDELVMRASTSESQVAYKSDAVKDLLDTWNILFAIENDADVRAEYERIGIRALSPNQARSTEARAVDLTLPEYIRAAAARGLDLYPEYGGDGLVDRTIREARDMRDGNITEDKVIRANAWGARHLIDLEAAKNSNPDDDAWPGPGAVAFYLWGIDPLDPEPAMEWFARHAELIREEDRTFDARFGLSARSGTLFHMENGVEQRRIHVNEFEIREADGGTGATFVGLAAAFNSPSEPLPFVERISPGAFSRSLRSRNEIKLFVNHDTSRVLASKRAGTLRLWESDRGLEVEADLPPTTDGKDMAILLKRGDVDSMSFGFSVPKGGDAWNDDGSERTLREVRLHEVSLVTGWPAYAATEASVRSLDALVDATGIEAERLNEALTALEKGEQLSDEQAGIIDAAVTKLRSESAEVIDQIKMKQQALDLLLSRV